MEGRVDGHLVSFAALREHIAAGRAFIERQRRDGLPVSTSYLESLKAMAATLAALGRENARETQAGFRFSGDLPQPGARLRKSGRCTTGAAAKYLGKSRPTIAKWIDSGRLPGGRSDGRRWTTWEAVHVFEERSRG